MNLLEKANTITTPTAYSNGFLYSVKPEVVENLLTYSNTLTNSVWSKAGTLTAGQSDKDGGTDAYSFTSAASTSGLFRSFTTSGVQTFSAYFKKDATNGVRMYAFGSTNAAVFFDLNNGVIAGEQNIIDAKIEAYNSEWWRASITFDSSLTILYFYATNNSTTQVVGTFTIQDIQLNKGLTAYPYLETTTEAKPSADFTFTRNSSATRVNELGYIEDVQIIGGELVSNGDFEEIGSELVTNGDFEQIGSELVTNGSFDTDTAWVKGTGWSIANGKASCDGSQTANSDLRTAANLALGFGKLFRITFEVKDYVSGEINVVTLLNTGGAEAINISGNGIYTAYSFAPSGGDGFLKFEVNADFIGSIDNVSVKEVGQDWTFGTGWSMGDGKAIFSDTANGDIRTQFIFTAGNKYRINLSVSDLTSGTAFFALGDGASSNLVAYDYYANGDYTFDVTAVNGAELRIYATTTSSSSFSIDNVSVKEVGQDWTFGTGWSMGDGVVIGANASDYLYQNAGAQANKKYRISWEVKNYVSGSVRPIINAGPNTVGTLVSGNGIYSEDLLASPSPNGNISIQGVAFYGEIDNVSVKEVTDDTNLPRINYEGFTYAESLGNNLVVNGTFDTDSDWSKGTGWSISGGVATHTGGTASYLSQSVLEADTQYRVKIKVISADASNFVQIYMGNSPASVAIQAVGEYEYTFTSQSSVTLGLALRGVGEVQIDNVSVQEVIGNLPVPYSGKGHLLLEGQRTNEVVQSENFTATYWNYINVDGTNNATLSPDGENSGTKIVANTSNVNHYFERLVWTGTASTTYTYSCFVKSAGSDYVQIATSTGFSASYQNFNLSNGTFASGDLSTYGYSSNIEDYGNGWYRVSVTATSNSSGSVRFLLAPILTDAVRNPIFTGNGTDGVYTWGHQAEQGSYSTSYIPTLYGTAVTRLGETCNNATQSYPTEGVLYFEGSFVQNGRLHITDTLSQNTCVLGFSSNPFVRVRANSVNVVTLFGSGDLNTNYKVALRYKSGDTSLWIDGNLIANSSSSFTFSSDLNEIEFIDDGNLFYGKTKMVATFPYLSNDEMECLTGEGYGTFEALAAAYSYTIK